MQQQEFYNQLASTNLKNCNIPKLCNPGMVSTLRYEGQLISCYLSTSYKAVYILLPDNCNLKFPAYVYRKTCRAADDNVNVLAEYVMQLADSDREIIFYHRYIGQINAEYVVLAQDETFDYSKQFTSSFYTTIDENTGKVIRAEPVQIYFCISEEHFTKLWINVKLSNEPYKSIADSMICFPGKDKLFDNFAICVIPHTVNNSPDIQRLMQNTDSNVKFPVLREEEFENNKVVPYNHNKAMKLMQEKRQRLYNYTSPLQQQVNQIAREALRIQQQEQQQQQRLAQQDLRPTAEQQEQQQQPIRFRHEIQQIRDDSGSDMELEFEGEPQPQQTQQRTTKISFDEPLIRLQKNKKK